jgi:uncharacterized glyoxalase superfamily protein PhnB
MSAATAPSLGYTILYVEDVAATLDFYERAFGFARRFFHDDGGKSYGELETGATRLAFASLNLAEEHLGRRPVTPDPAGAPLAFEIALVTDDVDGLYARALDADATAVSAPAVKPWGQAVAYVRDRAGYLVELCTAVA